MLSSIKPRITWIEERLVFKRKEKEISEFFFENVPKKLIAFSRNNQLHNQINIFLMMWNLTKTQGSNPLGVGCLI